MSQMLRQSELFSAQDWQVLYRAFTQINFNASDPASINKALRDYIRINYPEDFSDWIESSEFIAIIDLLSYLAGTLAFKTDINARENFLESAEARESILRLARFLSYSPRRNYPAVGLLKVIGISTDDDVYDAAGNNLAGVSVKWNNLDDPDWLDRFILLMNAAFVSTNQFGIPLKNTTLGGVATQLYRVNGRFGDAKLGFGASVSGTSMQFEMYNIDVDSTLGVSERIPNPDAALHLLYRTDGNGAASTKTGFFVGFRQGQLQSTDLTINLPSENQLINLDFQNINETDVWVQTLNDDGTVMLNWTKVPAIFSDNITFNSIDPSIREIFSVVTRDNDQISLRFSDGRFGTAPVGNMRFWFRQSNGYQYQIRTTDIQNIQISLPYLNRRGKACNLTLTLSLQETVANAATRESDDDVRQRAPQLYATQGRMVSGEDYNTFVLQSNQAIKVKALNRIYSGQSRYIDLNDPTGSYQDISIFADDGMFYKETLKNYVEIPLTDNKGSVELLTDYLQPMLRSQETYNLVADYLMRQTRVGAIAIPAAWTWTRATDHVLSSTGSFNLPSNYLRVGTTLLFQYGTTSQWVTITNVASDPTVAPVDGDAGPVALSVSIPSGAVAIACVPSFPTTLDLTTQTTVQSRFVSAVGFTLWFDFNPLDGKTFWTVQNSETIDTLPQVVATAIKVCSVEYLSDAIWRFTVLGQRYSFESLKKVRFFYDGQKALDSTTGQMHQDVVRILPQNTDLLTGVGLGRNYDLACCKTISYYDGYADPRRIGVKFIDSDGDGYPDDPDTYFRVVDRIPQNAYLFWIRDTDGLFTPVYNMWVFESESDRLNSDPDVGQPAFQLSGNTSESFWIFSSTGWIPQYQTFRFGRGRGPNVAATWVLKGGKQSQVPLGSTLNFHWKHFADTEHRVDPSKTNIIDIFVLTTEYDYLVRQWIANGADSASVPAVPTDLELQTTFGQYSAFKMFSDEIIWRPVKYKYLFGAGSIPALRANFKVIKMQNTTISDGEIKAYVIRAINQYFSSQYWDFGETFYFTELAAYIHKQMSTMVASVVLVPMTPDGSFGDGFEVKCRSDEIFISTAQVSDVTIISSNTPSNLRIK